MKPRTSPITEHRLARFVAWGMAVLAWLIVGAPGSNRSARRQRLASVAQKRLVGMVRNLILIRAGMLVKAPQLMPGRRDFTPTGFRRRRVEITLRRVAGGWLRRHLKHRSLRELLDILRNYRALGAKLARRRRKRMTRLARIVATHPPAHAVRTLAAPTPALADTS